MAFRWIDGFDYYSTTIPATLRYTQVAATLNYGTAGRFGGLCMKLTTGGAIAASIGAATSTVTVGFAFQENVLPGATAGFFAFRNSTTTICTLAVSATGVLHFFRGTTAGTQLDTNAAVSIAAGTWAYIEMVFTRNATTGAIAVYVNGNLLFSLTNQNTGASDIDNLELFAPVTGGNFGLFDDFYVTDTAVRVGERRIETLRPSSDSAVTWTPNAGANNWSRVSEAQMDGDTTYVSTNTAANEDLYGIGSLASAPNTIDVVQTVLCARKDDAATHTLKSALKSNATTSYGATNGVGSSYGIAVDLFPTDPNGGGSWSASAVNAAKIGENLVS